MNIRELYPAGIFRDIVASFFFCFYSRILFANISTNLLCNTLSRVQLNLVIFPSRKSAAEVRFFFEETTLRSKYAQAVIRVSRVSSSQKAQPEVGLWADRAVILI